MHITKDGLGMEQLLVELPNGIPVILIIMELRNVGPMFWSHYSYLGLDPSTLKINMLTIGL
jgi:hypothetical protein